MRRLLGSRPIELLFIDGDHTLEGVRRDLELYGRLLAEGGLVAFHDIVSGPPGSVEAIELHDVVRFRDGKLNRPACRPATDA